MDGAKQPLLVSKGVLPERTVFPFRKNSSCTQSWNEKRCVQNVGSRASVSSRCLQGSYFSRCGERPVTLQEIPYEKQSRQIAMFNTSSHDYKHAPNTGADCGILFTEATTTSKLCPFSSVQCSLFSTLPYGEVFTAAFLNHSQQLSGDSWSPPNTMMDLVSRFLTISE